MRPGALPLAILLGCTGKPGGESATDTSGGPGVEAPPCELSHPWPMDTVGDVAVAGSAAYPNPARLILLDGNALAGARTAASEGDPCPTLTESEDGRTSTISGDCTTGWGSVYGGTATFAEVNGTFASTYDHFHFEDGLNPYGYDVDGAWLDTGGEVRYDLTLTMLGQWMATGAPDVTAVVHTVVAWYAGSQGIVDGYVDIVSQPTSGATGDLCVSGNLDLSDSCEAEDTAALTLWGSTPATVTWNGFSSCDGCADVTIDGVDAGSYCPP